jgi:hypothetical protein
MAGKKTDNHGLEQAMDLLITNQAAFQSGMSQAFRELAEMRKKLDAIEAILLRHERTLAELPEAIRQQIGFKPQ